MAIAEHSCCFYLISVWILMYIWSHCPAGQSTANQDNQMIFKISWYFFHLNLNSALGPLTIFKTAVIHHLI